jgi:mannose-1-phosphate guanylyltransferase
MRVLILCGGSGTRLWPISRKKSPKQFAKIFNNESLFQKTIKRNLTLANRFSIIVNELQLPLCQKQVQELGVEEKCDFLIEPVGRNTAPAIALGALHSKKDETLLVLPSDHLIKNQTEYERCVSLASQFASEGNLVTFGIKANYPETGYGYIEADGNAVKSFKEKPDAMTAQKYLDAGNYLWNSGMFCFKASTYLRELENHSPEILTASQKTYDQKLIQSSIITFKLENMNSIPSDSIDYAVMENSQKVKVVPSDIAWTDLGSFDALYTELDHDSNGNTKNDNNIYFQSENNLVLGGKRLIATFNVEDLIIVDSEDALVIGKKGESQNVKKIVEELQKRESHLLI